MTSNAESRFEMLGCTMTNKWFLLCIFFAMIFVACAPQNRTPSTQTNPFYAGDLWRLTANRPEQTAKITFNLRVISSQPDGKGQFKAELKSDRSEFSAATTDASISGYPENGTTYFITPVQLNSSETMFCGFRNIKASDELLPGVVYFAKDKADIENVNPAFYFPLYKNDRSKYPVGDCKIEKIKP
jgi:hypothetical protein